MTDGLNAMLDKNSGGTGDESPLYTPEQEDSKGKPADIIQRMNQAIAQAPKTEDPENDAKKKGWQESKQVGEQEGLRSHEKYS